MQRKFDSESKLIFLSFLMFIMLITSNLSAKEHGGLILSGMDTLSAGTGFDFQLERACTSSSDLACHYHFGFTWTGDSYASLIIGQGLIVDFGKSNLDSIKFAPPDTQMKADLGIGQPYRIFRITLDSLQKCIGNCYIFKTAPDFRDKYPYYAKIRIIKFIVLDSVNHNVKMVFLWAANISGTHDVSTFGLDTFHLETPTLNQPGNNLLKKTNYFSVSQAVFSVSGNNFSLPQELMGKVKWLSVWDLQGKRLSKIRLNKSNLLIQMPKDLRKSGILIVRAEISN